jgi:hypothetical protein
MSDDNGERVLLDPRRLPGFGPDWRRAITGAWYSGEEVYSGVYKHLDTERGLSSLQLGWACEWLEDGGRECYLNKGLHFGLPEAPAEFGIPLALPSYTGIGMAVVLGPDTKDWEPSALERQALGRLWSRLLAHVHDAAEYEVCFLPVWIRGHPEELTQDSQEGVTSTLDCFVAEFACRKVAQFRAEDYGIDDPQLLPWGYLCCPNEHLEDASAQGFGAGATGFIIEAGRSEEVVNWARVVSPVVRLDIQLDQCLLMFEVLWHGEALAVLSRHADPDAIQEACEADSVVRLVQALKPGRPGPEADGSPSQPSPQNPNGTSQSGGPERT